ncbi:MAG: NAD(P)-binding protein [Candidatus Thiodiazotropha taylori]|nr:NAD(P)-binding protein [Candidatus Thiodiazotropha taylori]MCG8027605.1 NAD(P)-binding protein [Candidatus Thiodiazotropha taylori]MCG8054234.1 NAD(P)-binding protein [Candidatus Thiodiazotropha taylori]MCG8105954.1 NAD(P)-binding protein [Candidatus Thiodiazotropha taylori]MCG8112117.1 NAD(P)-binding protein [Candidatus Thiodiazotropha taylori]
MNKPFAITLDVGSSLLNKTGSWRTERPVYLDRLPPCNNACPAGENIQAWLYHAEEGRYEQAWREIMKNNPFPAVMGRVCYHPCEKACNRVHLDDAVGINSVERFLGDQALREGWQVAPGKDTGKRVMVVGAGPAGLACAYHLRCAGHQVTVYEASAQAGGMVRYGIPKYRMPREKLKAEIRRIEEMGVEIVLNTRIDDIQGFKQANGFDAVFLAIGAQQPKRVEIPSDESIQQLDAVGLLRAIEEEEHVALRGRVVVYGGGNTAIDVARSAIRMGATQVTLLVYEARKKMPAHEMEIAEALEEGVDILPLRAIREIRDGSLKLEQMVDGEGQWPQASGQFENFQADLVVQALGQQVETDLLQGLIGVHIEGDALQVDVEMKSGCEGIFAGGDMVPSARTVTTAIGHGKHAARSIDAWLCGEQYRKPVKHELVEIDKMNTWYYTDAPRTVRPMLDIVRRQSGFAEVVGDLDEINAAYEARRCMSCGNCFECDNCYGVCPDNAITKLGPGNRFKFKYDYCKGCGMCATECPCGAIKMEPESI